jgi:hypothetical protein
MSSVACAVDGITLSDPITLSFGGNKMLSPNRSLLVLLGALVFLGSAAHADVLTTYTFDNGVFQSGGTVTGTVTIDSTNNTATANLIADGISFTDTETGLDAATSGFYTSPTSLQFLYGASQQFDIFFPDIPNLAAFTGGAVCTTASALADCELSVNYGSETFLRASFENSDSLVSGTLDPLAAPSATPEPSSLVLLGTGALGLAGAVRRRVLR